MEGMRASSSRGSLRTEDLHQAVSKLSDLVQDQQRSLLDAAVDRAEAYQALRHDRDEALARAARADLELASARARALAAEEQAERLRRDLEARTHESERLRREYEERGWQCEALLHASVQALTARLAEMDGRPTPSGAPLSRTSVSTAVTPVKAPGRASFEGAGPATPPAPENAPADGPPSSPARLLEHVRALDADNHALRTRNEFLERRLLQLQAALEAAEENLEAAAAVMEEAQRVGEQSGRLEIVEAELERSRAEAVQLRQRALEAEAKFIAVAAERDAQLKEARARYDKTLQQATRAKEANRRLLRNNSSLLEEQARLSGAGSLSAADAAAGQLAFEVEALSKYAETLEHQLQREREEQAAKDERIKVLHGQLERLTTRMVPREDGGAGGRRSSLGAPDALKASGSSGVFVVPPVQLSQAQNAVPSQGPVEPFGKRALQAAAVDRDGSVSRELESESDMTV